MKCCAILLFLVLLLPSVLATSASINIFVTDDEVVREEFTIIIESNQTYSSFVFTSPTQPLSVSYDGEYSVEHIGSEYIITFEKNIVPGKNTLSFTLLYDNLIENAGELRMFRTEFSGMKADLIEVSLTLPEGFVLSGTPSVIPDPSALSTDGQSVILTWEFTQQPSIIVFYEDISSNMNMFIIAGVVVIILAGVFIFLYSHRKVKRIVEEMLTTDEQAILAQIRKGVAKQKDVAKNLGFSKSKMSKVIRKLEEKGLVEKEPHFKTNILRIKKIK